jgi:hypothetical protein
MYPVQTHLSQRDEHVAALMRGENEAGEITTPCDDVILERETQGSQDVLRKYLSVIVEESPERETPSEPDFMMTGVTRGKGRMVY